MNYTTITACRSCGSTKLVDLFSLGNQYVSDFVDKENIATGLRCPIDIALCRACTLVQAKHTPPPDQLYRKFYWYRSGVTQTMREALADVARAAERVAKLTPGDIVLDIGSNDGTLLRSYTTPSITRVGVEPAENLREEGSQGIEEFIGDFWSAASYFHMADRRLYADPTAQLAKVITACGMLYDLDDPNPFIADVAKVLHPEGVFIAQLMCLKQTLEKKDVGNFAHEHLEYYSLRSLDILFARHGLEIFDIEENSVNGGSYRLFVRHKQPAGGLITDGYRRLSGYMLYEEEPHCALHNPDTYISFFQEIERGKEKVVGFIQRVVAEGKRVWIYGASTKGNVITQWYDFTCPNCRGFGYTKGGPAGPWEKLDCTECSRGSGRLIEYAADRSPEKWGKHMVGSGIPIVNEAEFRLAAPEYALVLPYAFLEEFVSREASWLAQGGQFIIPLPEPRLVRVERRILYESL